MERWCACLLEKRVEGEREGLRKVGEVGCNGYYGEAHGRLER